MLLIVLDTLRADCIGKQYGEQAVMPFLTDFAGKSVYFTRAVSPSNWTKPAMASVFTSLYPGVHGVHYGARQGVADDPTSDVLGEQAQTLAEYLRESGYQTKAVQTNANLTAELGFAQGFEEFEFKIGANARAVTDATLAQLAQARSPFLLYAHYFDPHFTYEPPAEFRALFPDAGSLPASDQKLLSPKNVADFYWDTIRTTLKLQPAPRLPRLSDAGRDHLHRLYDAEVRFMDSQVQRLVETVLKEHPNTLVVVLSDHGEEFWEHGGMGHGTTMFEELLCVPLLLHGPGLQAVRIDKRVEALNLLPTVAAYLKRERSPAWQGVDLLRADTPSQPAFVRSKGFWITLQVDLECVIEGDRKLVLDHTHNTASLYDLQRDPAEQQDITGDAPAEVEKLKVLLEQHRASNSAHPQAQGTTAPVPLSDEEREHLRALGYLGGDGK
ncbi:MAG: sulfatase [Candidatus Hydrogenedentes bacterium]|nr:sulfatase [Candidatus Hydrogenedentota bacterium]